MSAPLSAACRPLRVEMAVPSLPVGGMELMTASLARALARRGHVVGVTCIAGAGELVDSLAADGTRVSVVLAPGKCTVAYARDLVAHFRALRPDVVHSHSGAWTKTARAARRAGVTMVGHTSHGPRPPGAPWWKPWLDRLGASSTDWIAVVSEPQRTYYTRDLGIPEERVHVVVNGVDTARFRPGPRHGALRRRIGVDDATPLAGVVARLDAVKNHALLLKAFAAVLATCPGGAPAPHLVVVGDGDRRAALEAQAAALGIGARVHFPGTVAAMETVYPDLDLLVLPSLLEGKPMSVLEAMACGLCVVASAVGGVPHLLDGGTAGTLVPSGDREALAVAIRGALADPARRAALGTAARARAVAAFSEDAMVDRYERLYHGR